MHPLPASPDPAPSNPAFDQRSHSSSLQAPLGRIIEGAALTPFHSPYLMGGYKRDETHLTRVHIDSGYVCGLIDVVDIPAQSPEEFHFTAPLTFLWVAQLGIIYGCIDNGLPRKQGEALVRKFSLTCRRPVRRRTDIPIVLRLRGSLRRTDYQFYAGKFDVDDGAFTGDASFILPLTSKN